MEPISEAVKVLIVEDELIVAHELKSTLEQTGIEVTDIVDSYDKAIRSAQQTPPDVTLADIHLKGKKTGVDLTHYLHNILRIPVVILSAYSDKSTIQKVKSVSSYGYLIKPYNKDELHGMILSAHEQFKMKQALSNNHELMQSLLFNFEQGLIITNDKGVITFANAQATEFLPEITTSLLNQEFTDCFLLEKQKDEVIDNFAEFVDSYEPLNSRYRLNTQADSPINWVQLDLQHVSNPQYGDRYIIIMRNIDAEIEQEEHVALLSEAVAQSDEAIFITDSNLNLPGPAIVYVNDAFCKMTGYSRNELLGGTPRILQGEKTDRTVLDQLRTSLKAGQAYSATTINYKKGGTPYRVRWRISPVRDKNGDITHWISVQRDVTESYRVRQKLINSEAQLRALLDSDTQATILLGTDKKVLDYNQPAQKLSKKFLDKSLDIDLPLLEILTSSEQTQFNNSFERVLEGEVITEERQFYNKHDRAYWFLITQYPVENSQGDILGICLKLEDITRKKEHQLQLQKSEEKLQSLLYNSTDLITIIDRDNKITLQSGSCEKILGMNQSELLNQNIKDFIHPEDQERFQATIKLVLEEPEQTPILELRLIDNEGRYRILQSVFNNQLDDEQLQGFVINSRDVTDIRKTEEALALSEERYSTLTERLPDGFFKTSPDGELANINPAFVKMLGYSNKEELLSREIESGIFFSQEERTKILERMSDPQSGPYTFRLRKANGDVIWVEEHGRPIHNAQGEITHYEGVIRDITERKKMEDVLRGIAEGVSSVNRDDTGCDFFKKLVQHLKNAIDVDYIRVMELLPTDSSKANVLAYYGTGAIETGETFNIQNTICEQIINEREVFIENDLITDNAPSCFKDLNARSLAGISLQNQDGQPIGALMVMSSLPMLQKDFIMSVLRIVAKSASDQLERFRYEQQLIEAKHRAEEMNRLKSNFLANMSHEIRTPMNSIMGFASLIEEEEDPQTRKHFIERIQGSGHRLLNTIDALLDLAKIEANRVELNLKTANIGDEVKAATGLVSGIALRKNLKLTTNIIDQDCYANIDENIFSRTINNLVGNAIKFTEDGEVRVEVYRDADEVHIKVSDTGIGIDKDFLPNIFNEFNQESTGLNRKFEGTGLGLTITRKYVDLLNGTIEAESEKGVGSVFTIRLPLAEPETKTNSDSSDEKPTQIDRSKNSGEQAEQQRQKSEKPRLLIVEDHQENQEILKLFLKKDFEVDVASYNEEALQYASSQSYDLFLIDINLAYGDSGSDLLVALREMAEYKTTPLIAVTAYAMAEDEDRFLNEGFTSYISKPFTKKKLLETINGCLEGKQM